MFINKEGKMFGKISIIDLVIIFVLIIAGFGIYSRYISPKENIATTMQEIEYTVKIKDVRIGTVEALKKKGVIYNDETKDFMGEIIDVKETQAMKNIELYDGTIKNVEVPEKFDVLITVKMDGKVNSSGYYTSGNQTLTVGSKHTFTSKYLKAEGEVTSIREVK